MDSFDNFQYDSASSYGGIPIVDDTSSVVSGFTTTTQNRLPADLESLSGLSLADDSIAGPGSNGVSDLPIALRPGVMEEDLDGVLDDLKDESALELPPHACRYVLKCSFDRPLIHSCALSLATVAFIPQHPLSNA